MISESYAQEDSNPKTLSIENPYSVKHTNWLKRKGVNIKNYDLSNDHLNANIQDAIDYRSTSKAFAFMGAGFILLNMVVNSYGSLAHGLSNSSEGSYKPQMAMYYLGGVLIVGSAVYSEKATKSIKQIKARYELDY